MRVPTCVLACLLGVLALVGCDDGEADESVSAARLPDDLCQAIPDEVVARWRLVDDGHQTERSEDRNTASCAMSGRVDDVPVTLQVRLTSYAAADADTLRSVVDQELADRCGELESTGEGRFTDTDRRCSVESRGRVTEVSISNPSRGVVTVSMAHSGPLWQLVGAEVVGLSGAIANAEPEDLRRRSGARRS